MEHLRGHTTGFAVPVYVVDAPGGGGKIPLGPQYLLAMGTDTAIVRNYEGVIAAYHQPRYDPGEKYTQDGICKICGRRHEPAIGVAGLFEGTSGSLVPEHLARLERRKEH